MLPVCSRPASVTMYEDVEPSAMLCTLLTKLALTVTGLFLRNVMVIVVPTPARTVTGTGSAIQLPTLLPMLLQATLNASPPKV